MATTKATIAAAAILTIALTAGLMGGAEPPIAATTSAATSVPPVAITAGQSSDWECAQGSVRLPEPTPLASLDQATIERSRIPASVVDDSGVYLDTCGVPLYADDHSGQHEDHTQGSEGALGLTTTQPPSARKASGRREIASSAPAPLYPLSETFTLASRPGAHRTIYLDFQGELVSGTNWNRDWNNGSDFAVPPWSLDSDPAVSDKDLRAIQEIWARVAEDFAPFDVNVTTTDPGAEALLRADTTTRVTADKERVKVPVKVKVQRKKRVKVKVNGRWEWKTRKITRWRTKRVWVTRNVRQRVPDDLYGTHVLIARERPFKRPCSCGGMAVLDGLHFTGDDSGLYRYAHVFGNGDTDGYPKFYAESISHEVGHTFGLDHDGIVKDDQRSEYYTGTDIWAPIMGLGYEAPISQWSQGEYAGATNLEDDIARIARYAPLVADDHPDQIGPHATVLHTVATGSITTRADRDVFALQILGERQATITAGSGLTVGNLDVRLTLLDANGNVIAVDDPPTFRSGYATAAGHDATITASLTAGTYYVAIDGVGTSDPDDPGHSDYGSLGNYSLTATLQ